MPKFSVILPTYSHAKSLPFAMESYLSQSEEDFELIVVGDGCSRECASVAKSYADSRVRFMDLPKAFGVGYSNRNAALKEAKGEIIAYATDDDIVFKNHLEVGGRLFDRQETQWAYTRPLYVNLDGIILPEFSNIQLHGPLNKFMKVNNVLPSGCIFHRRPILDLVSYWPEDFEQEGDWELWKRIIGYLGPHVIGYSREPTMMHFITDRRTPEESRNWPGHLALLRAIATFTHNWPEMLKIHSADEKRIIQDTAYDLINSSENFHEKIAEAVFKVADHLAWSSTQNSAMM